MQIKMMLYFFPHQVGKSLKMIILNVVKLPRKWVLSYTAVKDINSSTLLEGNRAILSCLENSTYPLTQHLHTLRVYAKSLNLTLGIISWGSHYYYWYSLTNENTKTQKGWFIPGYTVNIWPERDPNTDLKCDTNISNDANVCVHWKHSVKTAQGRGR